MATFTPLTPTFSVTPTFSADGSSITIPARARDAAPRIPRRPPRARTEERDEDDAAARGEDGILLARDGSEA